MQIDQMLDQATMLRMAIDGLRTSENHPTADELGILSVAAQKLESGLKSMATA